GLGPAAPQPADVGGGRRGPRGVRGRPVRRVEPRGLERPAARRRPPPERRGAGGRRPRRALAGRRPRGVVPAVGARGQRPPPAPPLAGAARVPAPARSVRGRPVGPSVRGGRPRGRRLTGWTPRPSAC